MMGKGPLFKLKNEVNLSDRKDNFRLTVDNLVGYIFSEQREIEEWIDDENLRNLLGHLRRKFGVDSKVEKIDVEDEKMSEILEMRRVKSGKVFTENIADASAAFLRRQQKR